MKLGTAKTVTVAILLAALGVACIGQFLTEEGSSDYMMSLCGALVMLAVGLVVAFIWGRCPNCGHRLFYKFLKWKQCPRCGKKLENDKMFVKPSRLK